MEKNEKSKLTYLSDTNIINDKKVKEELQISSTRISGKQRYYILDNFKGILIFMVVFAHFLLEYSNSDTNSLCRKIVVFIYFFHMEAFIFISGLLTSENSVKIINALKFLILYYISIVFILLENYNYLFE